MHNFHLSHQMERLKLKLKKTTNGNYNYNRTLEIEGIMSDEIVSRPMKGFKIKKIAKELQMNRKDLIENVDFRLDMSEDRWRKDPDGSIWVNNVNIQPSNKMSVEDFIIHQFKVHANNERSVDELEKWINGENLSAKQKAKSKRKKNRNKSKKRQEESSVGLSSSEISCEKCDEDSIDGAVTESNVDKVETEERAIQDDELHTLEINVSCIELDENVTKPDASSVNNHNNKYLEFLLKSIKEKEADLECPVCLETAEGEIFSCPEQHLLCSSCGPRVAECPECRAQCRDPPRRHRYAERMAAELRNLRQELAMVTQAE